MTDAKLQQDLEDIRKSSSNISTILEQEIIRSRYVINALASVLDDGLIVIDIDTNITVINAVACSMLGLDNTVVGKKLSEFYPDAFTESMRVQQREWTIIDSVTGLPRYLDVVVSRLGSAAQESAFVLLLRDVTYKKAQEYKILDLSSFQHNLISSIPVPTFYSDKNGGYLRGSQSFFDLIGVSRLKALSKTVEAFFPRSVANRFKDLRIHSDKLTCNMKAVASDEYAVTLYKNLLKSPDGVIIGIVGCLVAREEALQEDLGAVVLKSLELCTQPVALIEYTTGRIFMVNNAFVERYGRTQLDVTNYLESFLTSVSHTPRDFRYQMWKKEKFDITASIKTADDEIIVDSFEVIPVARSFQHHGNYFLAMRKD